jgi:predicted transcriptional regulator
VLGPLEADVMAVLWAAPSPLTVRQVLERLNGGDRPALAYTTVMTVMARLADKGILRREPAPRGFRYAPVVRDRAGIAVREVVRNFGETAVAPFVEEVRADPRLLRRLRKLLDEAP